MLAFSVRTLLGVVAVAAVAISALIQRTPIWTSALVSLAMALFMVAAILAMLRPAKRTFWLPVAVIGWTYLAIVFVQPMEELHRSLMTAPLAVKVAQLTLPTTELPALISMEGRNPFQEYTPPVAEQSPLSTAPKMSTTELMPYVLASRYTYPTLAEFYFSLQSLLALVFAVAGGLMGQFFLGRTLQKPVEIINVPAESNIAA